MEILGSCDKRYLPHLFGQGGKEGTGNSGCYAVVRGTTILKTVVLQIATGTIRATTTTTSGFGWFAFLRRALFCTRFGGWESSESVREESRLVPAIPVTVSENQAGLGTLVGVKAEGLPNLLKKYTFAKLFNPTLPSSADCFRSRRGGDRQMTKVEQYRQLIQELRPRQNLLARVKKPLSSYLRLAGFEYLHQQPDKK